MSAPKTLFVIGRQHFASARATRTVRMVERTARVARLWALHYSVFLLLPLAIAAVAIWRARRCGLAWWWAAPAAALVVALGALLSFDTRNALADALNHPAHHVRAHLWDISQWIRWPLAMALTASLLWWFERSGGSGARDLKVDSWSRTPLTDGVRSDRRSVGAE